MIQVPTLWDLAHKAGLKTASVYWPVTVGANVNADFPEYHHPLPDDHDRMFYRALCTPGFLAEYKKSYGRLPLGKEFNDRTRAQMAAFGGGGSFGLVVHDSKDREAIDLATKAFQQLYHDGSWGIDQLITAEQLKTIKGYTNSFLGVSLQPGFTAEGGDAGPWLTPSQERDMHGYAPGPKNMNAAFAILGPGIKHGKLSRGHIVDVAPTVAGGLGFSMSNIEGTNILPQI